MPDDPASPHPSRRTKEPAREDESGQRFLAMAWPRLPLWLRWALALVVFAGLGVGLVALRAGGGYGGVNTSANAEADRVGRIVVRQDQTPHSAPLRRTASPRLALERAIAADVRGRIEHHELAGPNQGVGCARASGRRSDHQAFRCTAVAGDVRYPFWGVVDLRARRATWCKRDPPVVGDPALDVPVSRRCRV